MILTSRRQQRVLGEMLSELRSSDPYIVAGFATFTRLTASEPMPRFERVRHNVLGSARSFFRRLVHRRKRAHQQLGATTA
ncbi:MAG TPA: hypothetical protein VGH27_24680 [Streptosporangiaceae bacterium]|jgi:hypothetical protein